MKKITLILTSLFLSFGIFAQTQDQNEINFCLESKYECCGGEESNKISDCDKFSREEICSFLVENNAHRDLAKPRLFHRHYKNADEESDLTSLKYKGKIVDPPPPRSVMRSTICEIMRWIETREVRDISALIATACDDIIKSNTDCDEAPSFMHSVFNDLGQKGTRIFLCDEPVGFVVYPQTGCQDYRFSTETHTEYLCEGDESTLLNGAFDEDHSEVKVNDDPNDPCLIQIKMYDINIVKPKTTVNTTTLIEGDSILFDEVQRKNPGTYTKETENKYGCLDTETLILDFVPMQIERDTVELDDCQKVRDMALDRPSLFIYGELGLSGREYFADTDEFTLKQDVTSLFNWRVGVGYDFLLKKGLLFNDGLLSLNKKCRELVERFRLRAFVGDTSESFIEDYCACNNIPLRTNTFGVDASYFVTLLNKSDWELSVGGGVRWEYSGIKDFELLDVEALEEDLFKHDIYGYIGFEIARNIWFKERYNEKGEKIKEGARVLNLLQPYFFSEFVVLNPSNSRLGIGLRPYIDLRKKSEEPKSLLDDIPEITSPEEDTLNF